MGRVAPCSSLHRIDVEDAAAARDVDAHDKVLVARAHAIETLLVVHALGGGKDFALREESGEALGLGCRQVLDRDRFERGLANEEGAQS